MAMSRDTKPTKLSMNDEDIKQDDRPFSRGQSLISQTPTDSNNEMDHMITTHIKLTQIPKGVYDDYLLMVFKTAAKTLVKVTNFDAHEGTAVLNLRTADAVNEVLKHKFVVKKQQIIVEKFFPKGVADDFGQLMLRMAKEKADHRREIHIGIVNRPEETMSVIPGKPFPRAIFTDNIELVWEKPDRMTANDTYQVRYKTVPNGKWTFYREEFSLNNGYICGLMTDTPYVFKVRLVTEAGESMYSEESEEIRTQKSFASNTLKGATSIGRGITSPEVHIIPMMENRNARNEKYFTRKYDIGPKVKHVSERTIMLLGATGTGKSRLVDGLANYIMGVNFEDPYRFTLASEDERKKQRNNAVSQTDWITCYSFHPEQGTKINYQLNVIDTPGFGDTSDLVRDQQIVRQIRYLFNEKDEKGFQCIDAVCFLVKAPDARLAATLPYVFQSLVSIFGKDIEQKICTLVTFADCSKPPVLDAMNVSKLPFGKYFTFNNSALFAKNRTPARSPAPIFWDMSYKSYVDFFNHLQMIERQSLLLTQGALHERYNSETTVESLNRKIDIGVSTAQNLKDRISIFGDNQTKINIKKDFEYEEKGLRQFKEDQRPRIPVTNCLNCNMTCRYECRIPDDDDMAECWAMNNGYCRECAKKSYWKSHKNAHSIFEYM